MTDSKTISGPDRFRCGRAGHTVGREASRLNEASERVQDPRTLHVYELGRPKNESSTISGLLAARSPILLRNLVWSIARVEAQNRCDTLRFCFPWILGSFFFSFFTGTNPHVPHLYLPFYTCDPPHQKLLMHSARN